MTSSDTSLGGAGRSFPDTTAGVRGRDRSALETLCRRYWKPIYAYVRAAFGASAEDAKDLTQAFFARLLEDDALGRYEPARGRFRAYLKVLLRSFVARQRESAEALKRGGGAVLLSLDADGLPWEEIVPDPRTTDPEDVFDRLWRIELAERVLGRLRERHEVRFRIYEAYVLDGERPTYAALAARLGLSEDDVRNHLHAARRELREALREELAATTLDGDDLDAEWNELFGPRRAG